MRDRMRHRGPDDAGVWISSNGRVGLGHRRLAIIDISPAGHQPMTLGPLQVVFNGEIYNYQETRKHLISLGHSFKTESDTEVLLASYLQWGDNCLNYLGGMFAFAIFDERNNTLFAARDRAGEKPFYYTATDERFAFASELKALIEFPLKNPSVCNSALNSYLTYGYISGSECILDGCKKLPPAHALKLNVQTGNLKTWRYWNLPNNFSETCDTGGLVDELEALLTDSIQKTLIADVPIGVMLSGGLDSSLIVALAARSSAKKIKTFNISFPGSGSFDEAPFARIVAKHFGTEHTELSAEPASLDVIPELARQYDEPMCDSSMLPTYLVSRLIKKQATVALGGDGGDELFGGYPRYNWLIRHQRIMKFVPKSLRKILAFSVTRWSPIGFRGRGLLSGSGDDLSALLSCVGRFFDPATRVRISPRLKGLSETELHLPENSKRIQCEIDRGLPGSAMALDFKTYLPEDILVKVDRASMLASLEVRAPFLDTRIIEFAYSKVPNSFRATSSGRKILLRMLGERLLPKSLDLRRKQGFSIPFKSWFKSDWGNFLTDVLLDKSQSFFDHKVIGQLLLEQRSGYSNSERLFSLLLFELWRKEYLN